MKCKNGANNIKTKAVFCHICGTAVNNTVEAASTEIDTAGKLKPKSTKIFILIGFIMLFIAGICIPLLINFTVGLSVVEADISFVYENHPENNFAGDLQPLSESDEEEEIEQEVEYEVNENEANENIEESAPEPINELAENEYPSQIAYYRTTSNLNLRERPTTESASFGVFREGSLVRVLEKYNDEWYRVQAINLYIRNVFYEGYMASEFLQVLPLQPVPANISEYGRQAAIDFLMEFPLPIFSDERMYVTGDIFDSESGETSEIYFRWYFFPDFGNFYTRDGIRILNAPWIAFDHLYATGFSLWDFGNDGFPDIFVYYRGNSIHEYDSATILFRYVDGEYRRILIDTERALGIYHWPGFTGFYVDTDENLVMFICDDRSISRIYNFVNIDRTSGVVTEIARKCGLQEVIINNITNEVIPMTDNFFNRRRRLGDVHYIPGMDVQLRPILPLFVLQQEIEAHLKNR